MKAPDSFDAGRSSLFLRTLEPSEPLEPVVEIAVRRWHPGEVLNERYTVADVLGEGGMGLVYRVEDALHPGRDLALKTLLPSVVDASRARLLRAEFRTMSELSHPNIARVWDFERIAGTGAYCFTMEFLEGRDLVAAADGAPLDRIVGWLVEACRALQYLHSRGVTHADLKPQNVVVTPAGHAKVLDFGLSAAGDAGRLIGTPAYMAPELGTGVAADARVDLYALGVTMFQVVYGRLPFSGRSLLDVIAQHASSPLPFPDEDPTANDALRAVMTRLCAKRPEDRFATAEEVIAALASATGRAYETETAETQRSYVSSARLVGRDAEEAALHAYCTEHTARDAPRDDVVLACVSGPSGVGKSRLVAEVKRSLQLAGTPVIESTCYEGALDELGPVRDVVQAAMRLGRAYGIEGLEGRHRAALHVLVAGAVGPERGLAEEESARAAALRDLADLVLDLSEHVSFALSIGDLHWARTSTTDFVRVLCDRQTARRDAGRPARLAVVVTHRDDEATAPLGELLSAVGIDRRLVLALAPLPPEHTAQLVSSMLGASDVPRPFTDRVAAETGGNPFFVEEVMRALMERGDVSLEAGRWSARSDVAHLELPHTIAAVLERRLASIDARARHVLEWLAVYAQPMPQAFVVEASGLDAQGVNEALETLIERHMVVAAGAGRFRPAHDELRELLVARVPASVRPGRHAAVARVLERAARDDTEYVVERAHHHWHARDEERARVWAERAVRLAEQTFAPETAIVNCERLRELAERRGDETARRDAFDRLLDLHAVLGQFDRLLATAREELARRTEPLERARILRVQGEALGAAGRPVEAIESLREAAGLLGTEIPRSVRARQLYVASYFVRVLVELTLGRGDPGRARALAPADHRRRELLGSCFWLMGVYSFIAGDEQGYGLVFPGIHVMLPVGRHHVLTKLLVNGAFASHILGRHAASERLARAALRVAGSDEERAVVLVVTLMARQLAQRPVLPEQPSVQTLEPDVLRAVDLLSTRSRAVHANMARLVATVTVYKYAARHERRPELARWAEAMRGTVHYGFVQAAVAAMAQIDGDRRRAEQAYERAYAGCMTDAYRTWIAGDFAFVCAVAGEVEKATSCIETVRRLLPAQTLRSGPSLWATTMAAGACVVLGARAGSTPWLRTCLEELVAPLGRPRNLPSDARLFHQAALFTLGRAPLRALENARRASRAVWEVEKSKAGYFEGCLVAVLALRRGGGSLERSLASEWAEEVISAFEERFPPGYSGRVRELLTVRGVSSGQYARTPPP